MKWFIGGLILIFSVTVIFFVMQPQHKLTKLQDKTLNNSQSNTVETEELLIIGDPNAPAVMIEYADYKCPTCAQYNQNAGKQIRQQYIDAGLLKLEYRPFPVYGADGARALVGSYCANDQGIFTNYHDAMYDYMWQNFFSKGDVDASVREVLTDDVVNDVVKSIGANVASFRACLNDKEHESSFFTALDQAALDDVRGTPTFVINGQTITGAQPFGVFKTLIDIQLQ